MPPRLPAAAAALLVLGLLAGCAGNKQEARPLCPPVQVLADASSLTRFASGGGRDLVDVDHEITILGLDSGCDYEGDAGSASRTLQVAVAPVISAYRGPANTDRQARFVYFVSVVDSSGNVLNKQDFPVLVEFPGNRTRVEFRDDNPPVVVALSAAPGKQPTANRIFVGFQLTPEELSYNRGRRAGTR